MKEIFFFALIAISSNSCMQEKQKEFGALRVTGVKGNAFATRDSKRISCKLDTLILKKDLIQTEEKSTLVVGDKTEDFLKLGPVTILRYNYDENKNIVNIRLSEGAVFINTIVPVEVEYEKLFVKSSSSKFFVSHINDENKVRIVVLDGAVIVNNGEKNYNVSISEGIEFDSQLNSFGESRDHSWIKFVNWERLLSGVSFNNKFTIIEDYKKHLTSKLAVLKRIDIKDLTTKEALDRYKKRGLALFYQIKEKLMSYLPGYKESQPKNLNEEINRAKSLNKNRDKK